MLYKYIIDLIYVDSPKKFQEMSEIIFSTKGHIDDKKLAYLRFMLNIKEKWATAYTPKVFHAGTHTISRAESVNS